MIVGLAKLPPSLAPCCLDAEDVCESAAGDLRPASQVGYGRHLIHRRWVYDEAWYIVAARACLIREAGGEWHAEIAGVFALAARVARLHLVHHRLVDRVGAAAYLGAKEAAPPNYHANLRQLRLLPI